MSSNDKEKSLGMRGAREFVEYSVESVNFPLESSYADALKVFWINFLCGTDFVFRIPLKK